MKIQNTGSAKERHQLNFSKAKFLIIKLKNKCAPLSRQAGLFEWNIVTGATVTDAPN